MKWRNIKEKAICIHSVSEFFYSGCIPTGVAYNPLVKFGPGPGFPADCMLAWHRWKSPVKCSKKMNISTVIYTYMKRLYWLYIQMWLKENLSCPSNLSVVPMDRLSAPTVMPSHKWISGNSGVSASSYTSRFVPQVNRHSQIFSPSCNRLDQKGCHQMSHGGLDMNEMHGKWLIRTPPDSAFVTAETQIEKSLA